MSTRFLTVLGGGGHGRVVADIAELCGYDVRFLDDTWPERLHSGVWPIVGATGSLDAIAGSALVSIGENAKRVELHRTLRERGIAVPMLVHPSATISRFASVGCGTVVMANAVANGGAVIGEAVVINTGATIDHDCIIEDGAHIAPGVSISGGVTIGAGAWIGVGAAVRQGIKIGARTVVGAGAVVVKDLPPDALAMGVPARVR